MDERLRFVARLLEGEKMAPVCRQFGISRVTGYKIFNRYKECVPAATVSSGTRNTTMPAYCCGGYRRTSRNRDPG